MDESKLNQAIGRITDARRRFNPVAVIGLFSGGHDSAAANLIAHAAGADASLHINTGIGVEQTREYVRRTCADRQWKLYEYNAVENTKKDGTPDPQIYADIVRKDGFPGPFMHRKMYNRLKQRQLERFERDIRATPKSPVIYISGIRSDESKRRKMHLASDKETGLNRKGRQIFLAPIHDWSKRDCAECMTHFNQPRNEVVDLIHKSGECLCGAFAKPGELAELKCWFPETAKIIEDLEKEVMTKFPWGWESKPPKWWAGYLAGQQELFNQPLCTNCNLAVHVNHDSTATN